MTKQSAHVSGVIWILLSAIGFGSMALFARWAYADGVDPATLLLLRFGLAAIVLGLLARGRVWPRGAALRSYGVMGVMYATMAGGYFSALLFAASSTVALVLYTFPMIVAVVAALLGLDRFRLAEGLAVVGAVAGMALMLGAQLSGSGTGFALAFGAAVCYSAYILLGSKIETDASPIAASCVVLSFAGAVCLVVSGWRGFHWPHSGYGWLGVMGIALAGTALAIAAFVAGLNRVGPTLASILSTLEPVVTIGLGIAFLHESLQFNTVIGGALILASALGLTLARMRRRT